ncbi:DUF3291 domain-containing protein [Streptosporangium subroseum]|uniref:DUF3291 domain-containing protein n=1 Tax=Streptosporangium subroseum TaxID=106412 RepID=UPI003088D26D|nr:DUF3291 domain-containing protein [Streptosporangium subroseum]
MHLAQLNVAHMRAPMDSPELAEFMAALEPIYKISDATPGFVWRLKEGDTPQDLIQHDYGDYLVINLSVWESRDTLWDFVYRSAHLGVMQRRREWFLRMAEPYTVMWWIPEGPEPTLKEGMERLELLKAEGPTPRAFTFKEFYDSNEAAWRPAAAEVRK